MNEEQLKNIIEDQKNIKDLPNTTLVSQMDLLTEEHDRVRDLIIKYTMYLDKLEELYNNILKTYQERTNGK